MFGNKRIKELEAENAELRKLLGQKVFDATTIAQLGTRPARWWANSKVASPSFSPSALRISSSTPPRPTIWS